MAIFDVIALRAVPRCELDSIRMEIWQPDIIVLPIPENKSGTVTSVQSGIYITNNTRNSFRFNPAETITPELSKATIICFQVNNAGARIMLTEISEKIMG